MFRAAVFAPWPRGLYLAHQLSLKEGKTAYIELLPRLKNPFGCFLDERFQEEKKLLSALGFLTHQKGGFCLLSPEGVWPLQDMREMTDRHSVLKNPLGPGSFKEHWLACLSCNLAGKAFEQNRLRLSNKSLNLFSDYFLFEPSFNKAERFQKERPQISFHRLFSKDISFDENKSVFLIQGHPLPAEKYFWLGESQQPLLKKQIAREPYWRWTAGFFKADFKSYENVIPSHFVSIKNIFLPWSHDNLLSVFHTKGQLEVWMRQPDRAKQPAFLTEAKNHLESFFPGASFSSMEKKPSQSFAVYGREILKSSPAGGKGKLYIEDLNNFFQGDLASELRAEKELFQALSKNTSARRKQRERKLFG